MSLVYRVFTDFINTRRENVFFKRIGLDLIMSSQDITIEVITIPTNEQSNLRQRPYRKIFTLKLFKRKNVTVQDSFIPTNSGNETISIKFLV